MFRRELLSLQVVNLLIMKLDIATFRKAHPIWTAWIIIAICSLILAFVVLSFLSAWTRHGDVVTIPEIKHMTYAEAELTLERNGLHIVISDSIYDKTFKPGTVIDCVPKAGQVVKDGRDVYVTITSFSPKHVSISSPITNVSSRQAISYLSAIGINSIQLVSVPSQYPDLVERALVNGKPLNVGAVIPVDATVILEVGTCIEPEPIDGEELESLPEAEQAIIEDLGQSQYLDI